MRYVQAGAALPISRISFGCWELGGGQWEKESDEVNLKVLEEALNLGINSFDTAEGYGNGHSEEILGQALSSVPRGQCFIATKVAPNHLAGADLERSLEKSLRRLRTDYVDLYYVHWPNPEIPLAETMRALSRLKEQGLIRSIGVSNFSLDQLQQALEVARIDAIQPEYSLLCRSIEGDMVPFCIEHDISIFSYSSIAKGILTGLYHQDPSPLKSSDFRAQRRLFLPEHLALETPLVEAVRTIAQRREVSMAQVAINWLLLQPKMTSAIVGTQSLTHLRDNVKAVDWELSVAEVQHLDAISRSVLAAID